ncbi:MAG: 23S rRNA (uracil(1939)-C(5))-methyltransferase RlmD [Eubacteriaceae bacterium]|nr:23S rRNA (uracil(1939)-C(5))-methyltransferase RlmD [Eubacteriaceae bacterium]
MNSKVYRKNDIITLDIINLTSTGEGIGKIDGFAVFVNDTLPGEKVKAKITLVKSSYAQAELIKILEESVHRTQAPCSYFGGCGGCQIQNLNYPEQLTIKTKMVRDALVRIGGFSESDVLIKPAIGMELPFGYRNKSQYKVSSQGVLGFYAKKSHHVVPLQKCLIQMDEGTERISVLNAIIAGNHISVYDENSGKGLLRGIVERTSSLNRDTMLIFVINGEALPNQKEIIKSITSKFEDVKSIYLNVNKDKTNKVMSNDNRLIWGVERIRDNIGDSQFDISPLSFFQVNNQMTKVIYDKAADFAGLNGEQTVFDLYCGIGTIGIYLSEKAKKVYGIEIVSDAIKDANRNAKINGVENIEFIEGKAEEKIEDLLESGIAADVIVLDPPRKGCDEKLLSTILKVKPARIVYVSCNPATLARDLKILSAEYEIKEVQPIDNFPHSMHVETVVLIECRKP